MAFKFPFTNYHELNLDWILKKLGELFEASAENVETIETYEGRLTTVEGEVVTIGGNADQALQIATGAQSLAETAQQTGQQALAYAQTAQSTAAGAINASATAMQEAQTARQEAQQAIYISQNTAGQLDGQIEALQAESERQQQAIEDKGDAVIASIPSEYAALSTQVNDIAKYDIDKYYPYLNLLLYPHLDTFFGAAPGSTTILHDDCNIVKMNNEGSATRFNLQLKSNVNNTIYFSFRAKSTISSRLNISEGDGTNVTLLGYVNLTTEYQDFNVSFPLTLTDVNVVRFTNPTANAEIEITNIIVSDSPINYSYSTKTQLEETTNTANNSAALLSGNIELDNLSEMLRNVFAYKYVNTGITFTDGYYIDINGNEIALASGHYATIPVLAGERYKMTSSHGSAMRMYVLKDSNGVVQTYYPTGSVSTVTETVEYTVPINGTLYVNSYGGTVYSVLKASGITTAESGGIAGKTWYALGDSITYYAQGYHSIISGETGVQATNGGVSGSGYMKPINNRTFVDRSNLSQVYDIVTVFGSVNDMQYVDTALGTATDTGTDTLGGCFNSVISNLYASGNYHIGIISPIPQGSTVGNPSNTTGSFAKYTALLEDVCRLRGVPYLDLWHCSNLQPWDAAFQAEYMIDNTHPNSAGHAIFAPRIKAFIESL